MEHPLYPPHPLYAGFGISTIDHKLRAVLPKDFREIIEQKFRRTEEYAPKYDKAVYIGASREYDTELALFDAEEWNKKTTGLLELPADDLERRCIFSANKTRIDRIGRMLLGDLTVIISAGAGDEVAFIGNGNYIRICNAKIINAKTIKT